MSESLQIQESYRAKSALLAPWMPNIISTVKKDLRQDHLNKDRLFCQKYFAGQSIARLNNDDLAQGYQQAIQDEEQGEQIAEFIFNRWLLKNTDIYAFFEKELSAIMSDFTQLTLLTDEQGEAIKARAITEFDAERAYLFSVINGVVFSPSLLETLRQEALVHCQQQQIDAQQSAEAQTWEKKVQGYETQIARLTDRYEKRLSGWEKKYANDMSALKKQVAHLQRQLNERR